MGNLEQAASTFGYLLAVPAASLAKLLGDPRSGFSALSLLCAFSISAAYLIRNRHPGKRIKVGVLVRALLPRRWFRSRSAHADLGMVLFNTLLVGALLGWAFVSVTFIERSASATLQSIWGPEPLFSVPHGAVLALLSLVTYLTYEVVYFIDHWLKHHVPVLWHFHRVHHTAETLSPLTSFRVHPIDSLIFYNLAAIGVGTAVAICRQVFGSATGTVALADTYALPIVATFLITHLQHSHMWIAFTGPLGRLILSPAHHQLHHSTDPQHYNRNFGYTLAVFDRWAGTLLVPTVRSERLRFGADERGYDPHGVSGLVVMPFVEAVAEFKRPAAKSVDEAEVASTFG